jgi:hypothetical protein
MSWPCDLCIGGQCNMASCDGGRRCQAALCTPINEYAAQIRSLNNHPTDGWVKAGEYEELQTRADAALKSFIKLREAITAALDDIEDDPEGARLILKTAMGQSA